MARNSKTVKQVQIIARYFVKKTSFVVYAVRSSDGTSVYYTTLDTRGHATGCTCPARKPCKHMHQMEAREQARREAAAPVAEVIETTPVAEVLAAAQAEMIEFASEYEVLAATKRPTSTCRHCGRNHHSNECPF